MQTSERIGSLGGSLTAAERRAAAVVLERPDLVAFGTVAELAAEAKVGAATVVRLAAKLGFDGFSSLQASVRDDLVGNLRPAAQRIREPLSTDLAGRHLQLELENVRSSLAGVHDELLADAVTHLADPSARVFVLSGDASKGIAVQLVGDLGALRDDVALLDGNDIAIRRQTALLRPTDAVITMDLRRYERWVVDAATDATAKGVWSLAVTDSLLSPLANLAAATIVVHAASAGPFDSHVGTLAVFDLLVTAVANRLRAVATDRLDRLEAVWQQSLTDG